VLQNSRCHPKPIAWRFSVQRLWRGGLFGKKLQTFWQKLSDAFGNEADGFVA
jgi:hypothetical protein